MEPPLKPDESDCCNSGCNPCILDVYEEQLRRFELGQFKTTPKKNCISSTTYTAFKLTDKRHHEQDALVLTFQYNGCTVMEDLDLLYQPGQYFLLKSGECNFTRAYTPIPYGNKDPLHFTILVKIYPNGLMSKYIQSLQTGDETLWRGPYGTYYPNNPKHLLLIAQGAGIAPIYSIIQHRLNDDNCNTLFKLLYCCKRNNTIYLRDGLYECKSYWNFEYEVFLSEVNADLQIKYNETVHCRKLNKSDVESCLLGKSDVAVMLAGSKEFMGAMKGYAVEYGVKEDNVILL